MSEELTIPEKLRFNAELVVSTMREGFDIELTFDHAGVEWIDGYIEDLRAVFQSYPPEKRDGVVNRLSCFLGESIIRAYGGEWMQNNGSWGVRINERLWACPYLKVQKLRERQRRLDRELFQVHSNIGQASRRGQARITQRWNGPAPRWALW